MGWAHRADFAYAFVVLACLIVPSACDGAARPPCTHLLNAHDSLFSVASAYGSDWITVWTLNKQLPQPKDVEWGVGDLLGVSPQYSEESTLFDPDVGDQSSYVRYAKPYVVQAGETLAEIADRFGTTAEKIQADSEGRADNASLLEAGTVLCVVPKWRNVLRVEGDRRCANDVQLRDDMT
uniref:LysM domain-containing protein n=1 Tax=Palpitomonas bilix TaxID=652834 RepID=A0A7S3DGD0_9EUKA|mmetsp:Transcript_36193/g.94131  ORF Transcript_36193/g.94131 Transcript_36193/m.94131 type:complete len:180 (+) Transcript_36193:173-712(+)